MSKATRRGFRALEGLARKIRVMRETLVRRSRTRMVTRPDDAIPTSGRRNPCSAAGFPTHRPVNTTWIRPILALLKPSAERPYTRQPSVVRTITRTSPERKTTQPHRIEATPFSTSCG